jgi:hypothetical protein
MPAGAATNDGPVRWASLRACGCVVVYDQRPTTVDAEVGLVCHGKCLPGSLVHGGCLRYDRASPRSRLITTHLTGVQNQADGLGPRRVRR